MKSFHLYLREPVTAQARVVTDYRPEDAAAFREQFRPVAEHYHRCSRVAMFGMAGFFACIILGMALPKHLFMYFWVAGIVAGGGTLLSPYRLHATPEQFTEAYPQAKAFFKKKKQFDPEELFENEFYRAYGK